MGSVFWITILYSLVGYIIFVLVSSLAAARLNNSQTPSSGATTLAALTLLTLIVSGPLSWGMVIRNSLRLGEKAS